MKNYIPLLITVLMLSSVIVVSGQEILLEEDVNADTVPPTFGPNLKNYYHFYSGYGFVLGADSVGSEIIYGLSTDMVLGFRYKRKLSQAFSTGFDISYHATSFRLKQDSLKILPNDSLHNTEKLTFHNLSLGVYNRFNYGKRGNYIGNFIDLGVRFEWPFSVVHFTKDKQKVANENNGGTVKTRTSGLIFTQPYYYSVYLRVGFTRYSITASYRLADLLINDPKLYQQYSNGISKYPELPPLIIGLEIGMHK